MATFSDILNTAKNTFPSNIYTGSISDYFNNPSNGLVSSSYGLGGDASIFGNDPARGKQLNLDFNNNNLANGNSFINNNTLGLVGLGLSGLSGLANAYMGYKNYKLAKDQFAFQKGLANRNLANTAKTINNAYDNAAQVAAGMIGGMDALGNYGLVDRATVDKYRKNAEAQHVDGSAIS